MPAAVVALLLAPAVACALALAVERAQLGIPTVGAFVFDYNHQGQDWSAGQCSSRERQSPIDFDAFAKWDCKPDSEGHCSMEPLYFSYELVPKQFKLRNNVRALTAVLADEGYGGVTYENQFFDIVSVNFHVASEHTFRGERLPIEVHVVHREPDAGHILIIAVLFRTPTAHPQAGASSRPLRQPRASDPGHSAALQNLMTYPLPEGGVEVDVKLPVATDLLSPLVSGGVFFEYHGSLTTPPCSERVTWMVRRDSFLASDAQWEVLAANVMKQNSWHGNYRATMPVQGRPILLRTAVAGDPPPGPEFPSSQFLEPTQATDFRGTRYAQRAIGYADQAARAGSAIATGLASATSGMVRQLPAEPALQVLAPNSKLKASPLPTPNPEQLLKRLGEAVYDQVSSTFWSAAAALAAADPTAAWPAPSPAPAGPAPAPMTRTSGPYVGVLTNGP